jgi:hypothetical protein
MNWERRLPPVAEDALDMLHEAVKDGDDNDGLPKDEAKAVLVADDQFPDDETGYALDVLHNRQNRGHIYSVDKRVSITPTDD